MVADSTLRPARIPDAGIRPLDAARDIAQVAALLEGAFGDTLDPVGQAALREMSGLRAEGWLGRVEGWLRGAWLAQTFPPGFVWVADGRVIGNVSLRPAAQPGGWLIGNVAVSPEYRRRGIARALMNAAIGLAQLRNARWIALQVEEGSEPAQRLYRELGFRTAGTLTRWVCRDVARALASIPAGDEALQVRERRSGEWWAEYELAHALEPPAQAWIEPLQLDDFRPGTGAWLGRVLMGVYDSHCLAVVDGALVGGLRLRAHEPGMQAPGRRAEARCELFVHPDWRGSAELPLLAAGLRRLARRACPLARLDYAAGETHAEAVLQALGFVALRSLTTMKLSISLDV